MTNPPRRTPRARRAAPLGAALLLAIAACERVVERVFTPPDVALRGVRLSTVGLGSGRVDVALRIHNPNPYALTATRVSYRLLIADSIEVGRGTTLDTLRVGARDSVIARLPLDVSWRGLQAAGRQAVRGGTVDYRILGDVAADTPIGAHTFPIDARGQAAPITAR